MGINTFDTANAYSYGLSETILGKAIKHWNLPRDELVIMTKVFFPASSSKRLTNQSGLSRKVRAYLDTLVQFLMTLLLAHIRVHQALS